MKCLSCGADDWVACQPGTEAQPPVEGNICWISPAQDVPMQCWCIDCWPRVARKPARRRRVRS